MNAGSARRRPEQCLSDFALDELVAARSLHVEPAPERAAHLAACSRCTARLAELEAVEPPALDPYPAEAKRGARRRGVSLVYAALGGLLVLGGISALRSRALSPVDDTVVTTSTRTKGTLALVVFVRDTSGNVRRLTPTDVVHPGESMRFELTAAQPGYAGVVGLDAAGVTTVYSPAQGALPLLAGGEPSPLQETIVMDETLGTERLFGVLCGELHSVQELKQAGEQALLAEGGDPTHVTRLGLPCGQVTVDLHKQPPH
ncbi:MAG TPA: hypothetical protein VHB79_06350 [Polyangiaceae bacterium]|nr:hypothetical protein [Polyangiaceae bacterium]